jgi:hypothetical protein
VLTDYSWGQVFLAYYVAYQAVALARHIYHRALLPGIEHVLTQPMQDVKNPESSQC